MPTYEYACRDCGGHLEVVQSFSDAPLTECPTCSGSLRKVFSAAGLIFKGSGWHVKDYAASGPRSPTAAGTGTSTATSTSETASGSTPGRSAPTDTASGPSAPSTSASSGTASSGTASSGTSD
ncbi:MAG: hypothetical protein RLZZ272_765 [Actinomycetota bacterium]